MNKQLSLICITQPHQITNIMGPFWPIRCWQARGWLRNKPVNTAMLVYKPWLLLDRNTNWTASCIAHFLDSIFHFISQVIFIVDSLCLVLFSFIWFILMKHLKLKEIWIVIIMDLLQAMLRIFTIGRQSSLQNIHIHGEKITETILGERPWPG